jgi:hypothetical protein
LNEGQKDAMNTIISSALSLLLIAPFAFSSGTSDTIRVKDLAVLRSALKTIVPGTSIEIQPGTYKGGFSLLRIQGRPDRPIVIAGADALNPPVFTGGGEGLKVSSSSYIKFKNIVFRGFAVNGINIDDGGIIGQPSHHILLENIRIENIGPKGNHDALKMAGVNHFIIRRLQIEGWGGSGVDLVGCHNGVIEKSRFVHREGYRTGNGIQIKGGSRYILVQNNMFVNSGSRIVQIGGLTGLGYFRPEVQNYEAKDVIIAGNTFIGGESQIAWVTAQESYVHHNLFYMPGRHLARILQESDDKQFFPCQRGLFEKNVIVVDEGVQRLFSIGKDTRPETFLLRGNIWNRLRSEVAASLPSAEIGGLYGLDPVLRRMKTGQFGTASRNPAVRNAGPWAYRQIEFTDEFPDIDLPEFEVPRIP